ncbi:MAG: RNA polymerase sigma factor [Microthrixaceae bacterium]|nr:RNA polymerase sigma factor [Microthrixaceae bacterium]
MDLEQARASDARRVAGALAGDPNSFGELFNEYFDRTYDVAYRIVRNSDVAAEVAQDTFLAAWTGLASLEDPASFGGWVLRISRNRALNRLSRERRSVALGDEVTAAVVDADAPTPDMEAGVAAEESRDLVWAASAALGERDASVLDLHLRHGLSGAALAEELNVTPNNANQILHAMKGRLEGAVRAFVLWRNGHPDCAELRATLARQSDPGFGVATARLIRRHLKACGLCEAEQQRHLAPAAMFSAVPILVAPMALRTQAAGALMGSGVPMGAAAPPMPPPGGGVGSGPGGSEGGAPSAATPSGGSPPPGPDLAATGAMAVVEGGGSPAGSQQGPDPSTGAIDPADDAVPPEGLGARRKLAAVMSGVAVLALLLGGWLVFGGDDVGTPGPPVARQGGTSTSSSTSSSTTSSTPSSTSVVGPTTVVPGTEPVPPPTSSGPQVPPSAPPVPTPEVTPVPPPDPQDPAPSITEPIDGSTSTTDPVEVTRPSTTTSTPTDPKDPKDPKNPKDPTTGGTSDAPGFGDVGTGGLLGPF